MHIIVLHFDQHFCAVDCIHDMNGEKVNNHDSNLCHANLHYGDYTQLNEILITYCDGKFERDAVYSIHIWFLWHI